MSEAARLEQSFDHAEKETFDLAEVASQTTLAYQELDPDHRIHYIGPANGCLCHGSPELLVQLLDKLVDNARDFTPEQGNIEVRLTQNARHLELSVFNEGSSCRRTSPVIFSAPSCPCEPAIRKDTWARAC